MMKHILLNLISQIFLKSRHRKKIMIFVAVGLVGIVISFSLVFWAGFATMNLASDRLREVVNHQNIGVIQTQINSIPKVSLLDCWSKAKNLVTLEAWVGRSPIENLKLLQAACIGRIENSCNSGKCENSETKSEWN